MSVAVRRLLACVIFLSGLPGLAFAAPPASCVNKFVGTWSIEVRETGQLYRRLIMADGRTIIAACPLCLLQTWTCNGNTFTLLGAPSETRTLSPDGRRMTGSCCVATRVAGSAVAATPESKELEQLPKAAAPLVVAAAPFLPRPDPRRRASGASEPAQGDRPSRSSRMPPWSGSREDCDLAGDSERQTDGWYKVCVDPVVDPARRAEYRGYKPSIAPQKLLARALDVCRTVPVEERQRCLVEMKINILFAVDATIAKKCTSKAAGNDIIACVHQAYLYGPGGPPAAFEERIRRLPGNTSGVNTTAGPLAEPALGNGRCQPGYGMKPAPGASGAWSCQPTGVVDRARTGLAAHAVATDSRVMPAAVQAFERRINDVAAAAVVVVADAVGEQLPDVDREPCQAAAFAAVWSVLKGGAPQVPEKCRPMATAARAELAYYAAARVDTLSDAAVDDVLSALAERGP